MPYRLAVTFNEEIIISYYDCTLKRGTSLVLMDSSGGNIRVIQPPAGIKVWDPYYVCCRAHDMFVVNGSAGDPAGVYRYTSMGRFLGCVTTGVKRPTGIALSQDGTELYIAEHIEKVIRIFTRE